MSTHPQLAVIAADLIQLCRDGRNEHQIIERLREHASCGHDYELVLVATTAIAASLVQNLPGGSELFDAIAAHSAVDEALEDSGPTR